MTAQAIRSVLFASDRGSARGVPPNSDPRSILRLRRGALSDEAPQRRRQGLQHRRKGRRHLQRWRSDQVLGKAPRHRVLICMKAGKRPSPRIISSMRAARAGSCRVDREQQRLNSPPMGEPMRTRCTSEFFDFAPDEGRVTRAGTEMAHFIYSN